MGASAHAHICYGVLFPESLVFPWATHESIADWWLEVTGFVPSVTPFTPEGAYREGCSEGCPTEVNWLREMRAHQAAHPLPVELVNCASDEVARIVVAARDSVASSSPGDPRRIDPSVIWFAIGVRGVADLRAFLEFYVQPYLSDEALTALENDLSYTGTPAWYLGCEVEW